VDSLEISFSDLPNRSANFLYDALNPTTATSIGHYQLEGEKLDTIVASPAPVIADPAPDSIPPVEEVTMEDTPIEVTPTETNPPTEVAPAPQRRLSLRSFLAR
jgi:hypothetical protein